MTTPLRDRLNALLDHVIPPLCVHCDRALRGPSPPLCEDCLADLVPMPSHVCHRCGIAPRHFDDDLPDGSDLCMMCACSPPAYTQARAPYSYEGPLHQLIPAIKYGKREVLMHNLSHLMAPYAKEAILDWRDRHSRGEPLVLAPMPMHWVDLMRRGFSVPMILSARIDRALRGEGAIELKPHLLQKIKRTPPQASLSHAQRQINLCDTMRVEGRAHRGRCVVLVDDVLTTGASAHQAARTLMEAGAKAVFVLTLARTP